jgi:hypothetical protein
MSAQATQRPLQQRCWNHESREAVCRCPECGNSYCRECVTEHEGRLLCALCLRSLARARERHVPARRRGVVAVALGLAGIMIAWVVFFAAGEAVLTLAVRAEQTAWQNR